MTAPLLRGRGLQRLMAKPMLSAFVGSHTAQERWGLLAGGNRAKPHSLSGRLSSVGGSTGLPPKPDATGARPAKENYRAAASPMDNWLGSHFGKTTNGTIARDAAPPSPRLPLPPLLCPLPRPFPASFAKAVNDAGRGEEHA
ncbi:hypothetical protein NL676_010203 [Syzygium grande]|nr:hypothetical protein NL676_010203 [Syzygium grande]